ncbi:hypothetical protein DFJ73DRAFT_956011 [Zopfochytrium polystomum]|nr:hypothetical protein DFJ73DRAFT_956011 [Zopfochytrium polystomum]
MICCVSNSTLRALLGSKIPALADFGRDESADRTRDGDLLEDGAKVRSPLPTTLALPLLLALLLLLAALPPPSPVAETVDGGRLVARDLPAKAEVRVELGSVRARRDRAAAEAPAGWEEAETAEWRRLALALGAGEGGGNGTRCGSGPWPSVEGADGAERRFALIVTPLKAFVLAQEVIALSVNSMFILPWSDPVVGLPASFTQPQSIMQ